jgi:hypothetical protein
MCIDGIVKHWKCIVLSFTGCGVGTSLMLIFEGDQMVIANTKKCCRELHMNKVNN